MSDLKPPCTQGASASATADEETSLALSAEEEAALLEAEADADAGRVVPHAEVTRWMRAVGTPDEFPMPASWLE